MVYYISFSAIFHGNCFSSRVVTPHIGGDSCRLLSVVQEQGNVRCSDNVRATLCTTASCRGEWGIANGARSGCQLKPVGVNWLVVSFFSFLFSFQKDVPCLTSKWVLFSNWQPIFPSFKDVECKRNTYGISFDENLVILKYFEFFFAIRNFSQIQYLFLLISYLSKT